MVDVRAFSGSTGIDNKELEAATRALSVAVKESELLDQQVSHGQSCTEILFKATRINFDFSIGKIVTRCANRNCQGQTGRFENQDKAGQQQDPDRRDHHARSRCGVRFSRRER